LKGMRVFSNATDSILFYTKTDDYLYNTVYMSLDQDYINEQFTKVDANGRRFQATVMRSPNPRPNLMYDYKGYKMPPNGWAVSREKMERLDKDGQLYFPEDKSKQIYRKIFLDEYPGQPANNLWIDIPTLKGKSIEKLGYPTQKPIALLERIIQASSNPGDVILDPFCGCGTAVHAAQKLGRIWVGIDITPLATALIKSRLYDAFKIEAKKDYDLIGEPTTLSDAKHLANQDRYQFQWWALGLIPARPYGGQAGSKTGKKGADKGIDGVMTFSDSTNDTDKRIIIQVKSGKVKSSDIRDLNGTVDREKNAVMGIFITLEPPSRNMELEAMEIGYWLLSFRRL